MLLAIAPRSVQIFARIMSHVGYENPLGPDPHRLHDRPHHHLGGDAVDGLAPRLPAPARPPWFEIGGWPVYYPPSFFWWWYFYDAYAPPIFIEGAIIAASGGFIAIAVAILMSVWRAREAQSVDTYGSARWARPDEVKAAGLLGPDGVVLGKLKDDYLRHEGPEHVLCFAPTRSGKGVGLVIPSLLTWPGSAIVHDIKGENWQLTAGFRVSIRASAAVRSDQPEILGLQSAARSSPRRVGGSRRPEHRRHSRRSRRIARRSAIIGKRPATRSWSVPSSTSSMPRRIRRSPASPPSSPIRNAQSSRRSLR